MKALSLWQPWATLIAIGEKRLETRPWRPPEAVLRAGERIAIHAGKHTGELYHCARGEFPQALERGGLVYPYLAPGIVREDQLHQPQFLPFGAVVATAVIGGCCEVPVGGPFRSAYLRRWLDESPPSERAFGDYTEGRHVWRLDDVRRLSEPVPTRGFQKLWTLPDDVAEAVARG